MSRMIDADALIEDLKTRIVLSKLHYKEPLSYSDTDIVDIIENAPTVEERKKGKWLMSSRSIGGVCSECGESCSAVELTEKGIRMLWKYCPNCGADMRGEQGEID